MAIAKIQSPALQKAGGKDNTGTIIVVVVLLIIAGYCVYKYVIVPAQEKKQSEAPLKEAA